MSNIDLANEIVRRLSNQAGCSSTEMLQIIFLKVFEIIRFCFLLHLVECISVMSE